MELKPGKYVAVPWDLALTVRKILGQLPYDQVKEVTALYEMAETFVMENPSAETPGQEAKEEKT